MGEPTRSLASAPQQVAAEGTYLVHYGDLRTGRLIATIPAEDASWSSELLGAGSASVSLGANALAREVWANTPVAATFWAVEWADQGGRRIVAAGPVWGKSFDTGATYNGSGIFSVFARRFLLPNVAATSVAANAVAFTGLDLGSIIRGIVAHVTALPEGDLPVILEASRTGTHTRTYPGYEVATAAQRITEISEVEGGAEFLFQPRLTSDALRVEWLLLTGTQSAPQISGATTHVLDSTAPLQAVVKSVSGEFDASPLTTTAWAVGQGSEKATPIRAAVDSTLTSQGFPRLETSESTDSTDGTRVQQRANGLLARTKRPARGLTVEVAADYWWGLGARLGDRVHLLHDHPILGRIDVTSRVLSESASISSRWVTLTLADTLAEDIF